MKKKALVLLIFFLCLGFYLAGVLIPQTNQEIPEQQKHIPDRIISINPAATEILFELGCDKKLVAISNYCDYPPQTHRIAKIGGLINPDFEHISMLKPDLMIIKGKCDDITRFCKHRNIEFININLRNINEIYDGITQLGAKLGCDESAGNLCNKISSQLEEIAKRISSEKKKKVFFSLYRTPGSLAGITTAGPKTFLSELITLAGGTNIFDDVSQNYAVISKESLLKRQPEIIFEPYSHSGGSTADPEQVLKDWDKLDKLDAVINNDIYLIRADLVLRPGPRISQAALAMAELIHPELFNE